MTRQPIALALWLVVMAVGARAAFPAPAGDAIWGTLQVPGGFAALQLVLKLTTPADEWRTIPMAIELSFAGPEGLRYSRAIQAYAAALRDSRERQGTKPTDPGAGPPPGDSLAPLPLGSAFWEGRFEPVPPPHDMLWAILSSREMSALYYGLLGLDDETLGAVQADTALGRALVRHALVLPTVGPALRVMTGRVAPPGGAGSAALWEHLVGEPLDRPAAFVNALLRRDEGRLAYFYATVASLPAGTLLFVTSSGDPSLSERQLAFARFYETFQRALGDWRADALLQPATGGPAEVLWSLHVDADGRMAGPPWRDFWTRALGSDAWPIDPARETGRIDPRHRLDAEGLLAALCPGRCDPTRLATLVLVQRERPVDDVNLAPALLAAARTRARFPALALEIQRMGLADPTVYQELGGTAAALERVDQPARSVALVQFQSAVALLVRLRALGATPALVRAHIGKLAALPVTDDGFDGALIRWLTTTPDAVFGGAGDAVDDIAERALAGEAWQPADVRVEWEDLSYRVDIGATERARIREARSKFDSNTLGTAATMVRLADDLVEAVEGNRVPAWLDEVEHAAAAARDVGTVSWSGTSRAAANVRDLPAMVQASVKHAGAADTRTIERAARELRAAADLMGADALAAIVYALSLHNRHSGFAVSTELPRRHHLEVRGAGIAPSGPWDIPREQNPDSSRRFISGSLLALDAGVLDLGIQRMRTSRPEEEPNMTATLAQALWRAAALAKPWNVAADESAAVENARGTGAAMVAGWQRGDVNDAALRRAGVAGPRAGWVRWLLTRGESPAALVTLEQMVRLGGWPEAERYALGAAPPPATCLCVMRPAVSWEVRGRPRDLDSGVSTILEPSLWTAVEVQRRGLPAALAPGVLALLTTDIIEQYTLPHPLDREAIGEILRRIPAEQVDDYIAAVAARGPLVRIEQEGDTSR